jgi:hypothetical protein
MMAVRRSHTPDSTAGPAPPAEPSEPRAEARERKPRRRGCDGELRKRLGEFEARIQALERRLADIASVLSDPALCTADACVRSTTTEQSDAQREVAWLMREWEELSVELAQRD